MPLRVDKVSSQDIPRLVEIYFSAFKDPLALAAFPDTPSTRTWWRNNLINDLKDANIHFVKCVDDELDDEIVAFAEWHPPKSKHQRDADEERDEEKVVWPEDGDESVANAFFGRMAEKKKELLGDQVYWYLELLATAPEHQRRGAASILIRKLLEIADARVEQVYLEGSPSGVSTYKRLGFVEVGSFGVEVRGEFYKNLCMTRQPGK